MITIYRWSITWREVN